MYEGLAEGTRMATRVERAWRNPRAALRAWLSPGAVIKLLEEDVTRAVAQLHQQARALEVHLADTVRPVRLSKDETFRFFRRLVNYDPAIADGREPDSRRPPRLLRRRLIAGVLSHPSRSRRNAREGAHNARATEHDVRRTCSKTSTPCLASSLGASSGSALGTIASGAISRHVVGITTTGGSRW